MKCVVLTIFHRAVKVAQCVSRRTLPRLQSVASVTAREVVVALGRVCFVVII